MTGVLIYGYLGGWVLTAIVVTLLARRLQDTRQPGAHSTLLSVVAGAAWPVLLLALAEAGILAATREVMHEDKPQLSLVS